jgi:hypothetical protein
MGDPGKQTQLHRVVRITENDLENSEQLERLLQGLYMIPEPVVDLTQIDGRAGDLAGRLKHLNRYHTSKGSARLRIVTNSADVRRALGGAASVFRFYRSVEEALNGN